MALGMAVLVMAAVSPATLAAATMTEVQVAMLLPAVAVALVSVTVGVENSALCRKLRLGPRLSNSESLHVCLGEGLGLCQV